MNFKQPVRATRGQSTSNDAFFSINHKESDKRYTLLISAGLRRKENLNEGSRIAFSIEEDNIKVIFNPTIDVPVYIIKGYNTTNSLRISNKDLVVDLLKKFESNTCIKIVKDSIYEGNVVYRLES